MILLDTEIYVSEACDLLKAKPGYRVIPLGVSCLVNGNITLTAIINLLFIFITIFALLKIYNIQNLKAALASIFLGLNAQIAFPYFYPAAHSYVYTTLLSVLSLLVIVKRESITKLNILLYLVCSIGLFLTRSESVFYFVITAISFLIYKVQFSNSLKDFWINNKNLLIKLSLFSVIALCINFASTNYLKFQNNKITKKAKSEKVNKNKIKKNKNYSHKITQNLATTKYAQQFPRESFWAVGIWSSIEYFKGYLLPYEMSFFGNFNDWYDIHKSKKTQYLLYIFLALLSISAIFIILKRFKHPLFLIIVGLSVFFIPTSLISSFLRNQWYFPARAYLASIIALPFFILAFDSIQNSLIKRITTVLISTFFVLTFYIHIDYHFKDEVTMYKYEHEFQGNNHPTVGKNIARKFLKDGKYRDATHHLRKASQKIPKEGIFISANTFFHWAESLYWSAATAYAEGNKLTERYVLKELYKNHNYFGALACLQDDRVDIKVCKFHKLAKFLCNKTYYKRFGYSYYKKPRIKAEQLCAMRKKK